MYSKVASSQLRQGFWTAFGLYMNPVVSAEGERLGWLNYKTGEKGVFFRMTADNKKATIAIELNQTDAAIREMYFDQFREVKSILEGYTGESWTWKLHDRTEDGKVVSRIYRELAGVSIYNKDQWPDLISFFKQRIMALDAFWSDVKFRFEALR